MTRRIAFLIGILFELLAVFGLFIPSVYLHETGQLITLRTAPVDPWSVFRGQYLTLDYEAGRDIPASKQAVARRFGYMVFQKKGDVYERVRFTASKPILEQNQACIQGVLEYGHVRFPAISQYFFEEGTQSNFQQGTRRLLVDVRANTSCKAMIEGVRLGETESGSIMPGIPMGKPPVPVAETGANR